ncbi:MAG: glycosyltransferase family 4 protein [Candidatus Aminicenantes bacterium]|nr:glycosyltransferase family 4 protein [Candidatus Aminicenantes bacterium]
MMGKKRVLFITHLYFPALGGAERVFQKMAEGLAKRGHDVTVLTSDALSTEEYFHNIQNKLPEDDTLNGVHIIRQELATNIYKVLNIFHRISRLRGVGTLFSPLLFGPHFYKKYFIILKQDFDVIIAGPTPTSTLFYGFLFKKKHPNSRFVIFPCMHIEDRLHTSPVNIWVLKKAELIFALTGVEKKYLISRGIKNGAVKKFACGVDDIFLRSPFEKNPNIKDYVLYLGQEGGHKQIPSLIKAMEIIWARGYKNKLIIAGARTKFSPILDELIKKLPKIHNSNIVRINNFSEEQKVKLIDNCSVLVNPSSYESFGIVFLEAWARKKPVIGANISALKEIIKDGINGFLFDPKIEGDLEAKIIQLLSDRDKAKELGNAGFADVQERYMWNKLLDRLDKMLET